MTAHERWLATGSFKSAMNWAGLNEARLRAVARARGYKSGWIYYRLKTQRETGENALLRATEFLGESLKNPRAAAGAYHGNMYGD